MRTASLAEMKDGLSRFLSKAARENIVITKHGKPAGVLIGFESEDDWFEYRLMNDPRFLKRIARARMSLRAGKGISWGDVFAPGDRRSARLGLMEADVEREIRAVRSRRRKTSFKR